MPSQQPALLTSWKEVASYLGKGVRTVQRWELRLGMPVRRPDNSKSGIIQVSREELDRWLESQWTPRSASNEAVQKDIGLRVVSQLAAARELRNKHQQLVRELRQSLSELNAQCEALNLAVRASGQQSRAASVSGSDSRLALRA
jgi:hypothetical protein